MTSSRSPLYLSKQLEAAVRRTLRSQDISRLERKQREMLGDLQQNLTHVRVHCNDYELSETREEQLEHAGKAKEYLDIIRQQILALSEADVFTAIDVADLSSQVEQIATNLK